MMGLLGLRQADFQNPVLEVRLHLVRLDAGRQRQDAVGGSRGAQRLRAAVDRADRHEPPACRL
jgi:hypothetical protein